jgi:hypothetical protein
MPWVSEFNIIFCKICKKKTQWIEVQDEEGNAITICKGCIESQLDELTLEKREV